MTKIELAKMIGLELDTDWDFMEDQLPDRFSEPKDLIKMDSWCQEPYAFCEGQLIVKIGENQVKKLRNTISRYNVSDEDWGRYYKIPFVKEYNNLVWTLATDQYLEQVHNAAMTIKL